ncbi:MAG: DUF5615 family PIN-like protein [Candidatus Hadarchaeales archaeon]
MPETTVLLDEMYMGLKPFLQVLGWNVLTVDDVGLRGASDVEVVEFASKQGYILVSQEPRVGELARLKNVPCVVVGLADIAKVIDARLREIKK